MNFCIQHRTSKRTFGIQNHLRLILSLFTQKKWTLKIMNIYLAKLKRLYNTTRYMASGVSHISSIQALKGSGPQADQTAFQFFHTVHLIVNSTVNI